MKHNEYHFHEQQLSEKLQASKAARELELAELAAKHEHLRQEAICAAVASATEAASAEAAAAAAAARRREAAALEERHRTASAAAAAAAVNAA